MSRCLVSGWSSWASLAPRCPPVSVAHPQSPQGAIFNRFFAVAPPALASVFESAAHLCEVSLDSMNKL